MINNIVKTKLIHLNTGSNKTSLLMLLFLLRTDRRIKKALQALGY